MKFRLAAVLAVTLLAAGIADAGEFTDAAGRRVVLPDHIGRILPAGPTADALVFVLAPDRLAGWSRARSGAYLPAKYARLPVAGPLPEAATRLHPDLILDAGMVTPERAAAADRIQQQTGIPYILVDDSVSRMPAMLRRLGAVLGVSQRADDLAGYAEVAIRAVRGRLLVEPADHRKRVYYGRRADGLETALPGSPAADALDESGVINVAAGLGRGERVVVTREEIAGWNPDIVIAADRGFYNALLHDPGWRGLAAVRTRHVYLEPSNPFGWIDEPPGVNRLIGLYWLASLFYPDELEQDLRSTTTDFYDKFYRVKLSARQLDALLKPAEAHDRRSPQLVSDALMNLGTPAPAAPGYAPGVPPPGRRGLPMTMPPAPQMPAVPAPPK
jgi:iron complex transport system substrate-binding protein